MEGRIRTSTATCGSPSPASGRCRARSSASTHTAARPMGRPSTRPARMDRGHDHLEHDAGARRAARSTTRARSPPESWVEYNVTPLVTGDGTYSFRLAQTSTDGVDFRAREYTDSTQRPQLVVTLGPVRAAASWTPGGGSTPGGPGSPLTPGGPFSPLGSDRTAPKVDAPRRQGAAARSRRDLVDGDGATSPAPSDAFANAQDRARERPLQVEQRQAVAGGRREDEAASEVLRAGHCARFAALSRRSRRVLAKVTVQSNDLAGNASSARATSPAQALKSRPA